MKHVVLVGMMGAGKTTVGRLLAEQLRRPFLDTDLLIEEEEQQSISTIFSTEGEAYFRQREQEVIASVLTQPPAVISIGGGAFLTPAVREILSGAAVTFYLQASAKTLIQRVGSGATRPLLSHPDETPAQRVEKLLAQREPIYSLADYLIPTEGQNSRKVAEAILQFISPQ